TAGVQTRRAYGLTPTLCVLGGEFQVEPQLLLKVRVGSSPAQGADQTMETFAEGWHFACSLFRSGVAAQQCLHDRRHSIPGLLLLRQLAPAGGRQRVEA